MLSRVNISQSCNDHPSTTSNCRSDFEAYPYSRQSSPSPPPSPTPLSNTWSSNTANTNSLNRHNDALYSTFNSPQVVETTHHRNHHHLHHTSSKDFNHAQSYHGSRSTLKSSPYHTPRSNQRLPSVIDRMKADLKSPNRSTTPFNNHDYPSPQPWNSDLTEYEDGPLQSSPHPTLFGGRCTEASQRAYTGQSSQMKKSFNRLQRMDNGKVEYRTIAFCTHLTVSRWEPTIPSPAVSTPSNEEENVSTASSTADNGQAHAARLLSLANYIRHILSLTVTVPSAQSNVNVNAKQQHKQDETRGQDCNTNPGFSATSSGPGPIKSESNRRHRFSPAYHHHPSRRNTQQPQYAERDSSAIQHHSQTSLSHSQRLEYPNNHGYREGGRASENRETSQFYTSPNASCTQQPIRNHAPNMHNQPNVDRNPPPLLKIPFPNLTLTLALIYVDRLKAKYPEAKGEPGCSHRLFLVAFIIAAKYRCSVELSPPVPRDPEEQESNDSIYDRDSFDPNQTLETRLNAALIFSNHAWVRLLNLGSFYRQPSSASAVTAGSTTDSQDQTPQGQPATVQSRSGSPAESPSRDTLPSLSSIINPAASSPTTGMMQVEDLDRMETEFLTFLDFDLATLSHDLETCWNLLVGKN